MRVQRSLTWHSHGAPAIYPTRTPDLLHFALRDLGKRQMFGVTLFVFGYIGMSILQFSEPKAHAAIDERPLDPGIVALLHVIYAGDLTNKAAGPN
jgi:hypothetical protein